MRKFQCGDQVSLRNDPRHEGRIVAINWDTTVRVLWDETGWRSDEHGENLIPVRV